MGQPGIAAGREIYGTPKVYAELKVRQAERSMLTETFAQWRACPANRFQHDGDGSGKHHASLNPCMAFKGDSQSRWPWSRTQTVN